MFRGIFELFGRNDAGSTGQQDSRDTTNGVSEVPRYPPFPRGLPLTPPEVLLETQRELLKDLIYAIDLKPEEADALLTPVFWRYAAFVHLLPASETHHHRGAGGLLRHGLEVALGSVREMDNHLIFDLNRPPRERRDLAPRWRACYALAGLVHDLGKPFTDVRVTTPDGQAHWSPLKETLYEWGQSLGMDRYHIHWRKERYGQHNYGLPLVARQVLTPEIMEWLDYLDGNVLRLFSLFIGGENGTIKQVVQKHDFKSVEKDLKQGTVEHFQSSPSPEHSIVSAMKQLIDRGQWKLNEPGTRIWHTTQGTFLVWPQAAYDIAEVLDNAPGVPRDPREMREMLLERGIAERIEEEGVSYDFVLLAPDPLEKEGSVVFLKSVRLMLTGPLFDRNLVDPVQAMVGLPREKDLDADNESGGESSVVAKEGEIELPGSRKIEGKLNKHDNSPTSKPQVDRHKLIENSTEVEVQSSRGSDGETEEITQAERFTQGSNRESGKTFFGAQPNPPGEKLDPGEETGNIQPGADKKEKPGKPPKNVRSRHKRIQPGSDEAGRMMRALAEAVRQDSSLVFFDGRDCLLTHPGAAEKAGFKAGDCVRVLFDKEYILPDPANAMRKVVIRHDARWLLIQRGLTWLFEEEEGNGQEKDNTSASAPLHSDKHWISEEMSGQSEDSKRERRDLPIQDKSAGQRIWIEDQKDAEPGIAERQMDRTKEDISTGEFGEISMNLCGDVIRQVRMERGLSQGDLADLIGVSRTYISKIEKGRPLSKELADKIQEWIDDETN
ncbi:MAG: TraI domain-containing protein [Methylothermaceae bacterium]|nr:TraI domain-containing protein [Methylothermaceae bacterium]